MSDRIAPNTQILEQAATWFIDFRADDADSTAREEFRQWLQRSPEHIQAYLEIASTYAELPEPAAGLDVDALIAQAHSSTECNVVPLTGGGEFKPEGPTRVRHERQVGARVVLRACATAAVLLLMIALAIWGYGQRETYITDVGEQRILTLVDGSTVVLNARSRIKVRYTETERVIELLEGQALFTVAHNKTQPFIVRSDTTSVRAIGTQFDVYRTSHGLTVTVVEGEVAMLEPDSPQIRVMAGQQATADHATGPSHTAPVNVNTATAWAQHHLVFDNTALTEVVAQFNRYNRRPIVLDPPALGSMHISGDYSSSDPTSFFSFLRLQPGIKVTETDREVRISQE